MSNLVQRECDAVVVGAGFFGCSVGIHLRRYFKRVLILEAESEPLTHASYNNQARVHNGYHYPRSITTALRSRINYPAFMAQYPNCVDRSFRHFYAVGRKLSNITARQFEIFCKRIGAPLEIAPVSVRHWFNRDMIEEVFEVEECAFDAVALRRLLMNQLQQTDCAVRFGITVERIEPAPGASLMVRYRSLQGSEAGAVRAQQVCLCTYARMNTVLRGSGLPLIPLRHEWTELALVQPPPPLQQAGVTVMCGPFFSITPFPPRGLHILSHVRYTPHASWLEQDSAPGPKQVELETAKQTSFLAMRKDAERFLPLLSQLQHVDSLWQTKTVLPRNDGDDGRPTLLARHHGLPNLHCILGGKIDNILDVCGEIDDAFAAGRGPAQAS